MALGLSGLSHPLWTLRARVTRAGDGDILGLRPLGPKWLKKVAWAGQKATLQKRSRRRMWTQWSAEVMPNVATRRGVRSTLCLIRLTFLDEKRGGNIPIFLRDLSASPAGHSPFALFATFGNFDAKSDVDSRGSGTWMA